MSDRVLRGALALTFVLLVIAATALVTTRRDVNRLSDRVDELSAELEDTRQELAEAEEEPPADAPTGLDGLAAVRRVARR